MNKSFEHPHLPHPILRWLIGLLALIVLLACDMGADDISAEFGVTDICQSNGILYAYTWGGYNVTNRSQGIYRSQDGGQTWFAASIYHPEKTPYIPNITTDNERCTARAENLPNYDVMTLNPSDQTYTYSFIGGKGIYIVEQGQTQRLEFDLSILNHDSHEIYQSRSSSSRPFMKRFYIEGVWDSLIDENSGNLILAMGLDGILLKADGEWKWITVGPYHFPIQSQINELLTPFVSMAFGMFGVLPATIVLWRRRLPLQLIPMIFMGWFMVLIIGAGLASAICGVVFLILFALISLGLYRFLQRELDDQITRATLLLIGLSVVVAALFLLPYALWVRQAIPNQSTTTTLALLLLGGGQMTAAQIFAWYFPPPEKNKQKNSEAEDYFEA